MCDSETIKRFQIISNDLKNCSRDFNFQRFDFYEKVFLYKVLWSPRISLEIIHGRCSKMKHFACEGDFEKNPFSRKLGKIRDIFGHEKNDNFWG